MNKLSIILIAFIFIGCNSKNELLQSKVNIEEKVETVQKIENVKKIEKLHQRIEIPTKENVKEVIPKKTFNITEPKFSLPIGYVEEKKLQVIKNNVPSTCQEWSDGCNTCTRTSQNQANCTVYSCENQAPFSCLRWQ